MLDDKLLYSSLSLYYIVILSLSKERNNDQVCVEVCFTYMWYETIPYTTLSDCCTVTLIVTFTNKALGAATFSGSTFQLWATPSGANPPVTINSEPSGTVEVDETFSYDLTVDVSALASSDTGLTIRPDSDTFGTMKPDWTPLSSETITIQ